MKILLIVDGLIPETIANLLMFILFALINDVYNKINVSLYFREFDATIDVDTTNQENEAHNLYSEVMNILEDNEDRYNKTMKYRKIRIQCFTISVGIILSYILYVILKINADKISPIFAEYLNNKYVLAQLAISILLFFILKLKNEKRIKWLV